LSYIIGTGGEKMESWMEELQKNAGHILTSKHIENFNDVVYQFKMRFQLIADPLIRRDSDFANCIEDDQSVYFNIYKCSLGLALNGDNEIIIDKTAVPGNERVPVGKITFNKELGCAVLERDEKKLWLAENTIDQLFKEAYQKLIEG